MGSTKVSERSSAATDDLLLHAPVDGLIVPLEQVPDPVFSQKIAGPGIAIDPLGEAITAPIAGEISQLHPSHHALTIRAPNGAEVLIHVGLETVKLKGEGFRPLVKLGDKVELNQELLRFDADLVARKAKSLLTIMVVAGAESAARPELLGPGPVRAGSPMIKFSLEALRLPAASAATAPSSAWVRSAPLVVRAEGGLHARPAAELASLAKKFKSEVRLAKGGRTANVRSLSGVMGLEVGEGESIVVEAQGVDAKEAVAALEKVLHAAAGGNAGPAKAAAPTPSVPEKKKVSSTPGFVAGINASPGCSAGQIFQLRSAEVKVKEQGQGEAVEAPRLKQAIAAVKDDLANLVAGAKKKKDPAASIFEAHLELVDDPEFLELADPELNNGKSADYAWQLAYNGVAATLASLNNQLLAARANDVRDVGRRVARRLSGVTEEKQDFPEGAILVAEDLTPSDVAGLDQTRVRGLCTTTGGATSHVAILARSLDLPALVGMEEAILGLANGTPVIIDANNGRLRLNPSAAELAELAASQEKRAARKREEHAQRNEPAATREGHRLEIVANIKGAPEAKQAVDMGGEGAGLLRTEFLFMNRNDAPSEEEQYEAYRAIAEAFGPKRTFVIRTLDVGGDKPLSYLPIPKEENPFLGERGIRVSLRNEESFRAQLRAILRVGAISNVHVMYPMVASLHELKRANAILEEERAKLGAKKIPAGVMVEVPSVALLASHFAEEADFFSIGSNDLTQYTLAIDRGHPKLAAEVDGLDPSILHLIDLAVKAAHAKGRWVGVCGGIAGDPQAVPLLVGLGVDELSVSVPAIPAVKAQIRSLSLKECQELSLRALKLGTAAEVRALVPSHD